MLFTFVTLLIGIEPNYDEPCTTCVGDYSGTPAAATKVWCPTAGCVTANVEGAKPFCDDDIIIYQKAKCRERNTRPASCKVTGPLKKTCSCPEGRGKAECRALLSDRLATISFEEPIGKVAAETYTQGEVRARPPAACVRRA